MNTTKHSGALVRVAKAFSLVEVVVAVGIFALAIVGVIGLLSPTTKAVADVADSDAASRVVGIVQNELQALASKAGGWDAFTKTSNSYLRDSDQVATFDGSISATADEASYSATYTAASYVFFASKDGGKVGNYSSSAWGAPADSQTDKNKDKFFEIILIRNWNAGNPPATPASGLSNPANDASAGYLAYTIRLRWPTFLPNGARVTDNTQKNVMIVPAAVTR